MERQCCGIVSTWLSVQRTRNLLTEEITSKNTLHVLKTIARHWKVVFPMQNVNITFCRHLLRLNADVHFNYECAR